MPNVVDLAENLEPEAVRIGAVLRNLRTARGMTLLELGAAIGRSQGFLSKVELGFTRTGTQLGLIAPIADAYGVTPDEVIAELYPNGDIPPGIRLAVNARKDGA